MNLFLLLQLFSDERQVLLGILQLHHGRPNQIEITSDERDISVPRTLVSICSLSSWMSSWSWITSLQSHRTL